MAQVPKPCSMCQSLRRDSKEFSEKLCESCKSIQSQIGGNKKDMAMSSAGGKSIQRCKKHPDDKQILYCKNCDECVCPQCVDESHVGHVLKSLTKIKNSKKEEMSKIKSMVQEKEMSFKEKLEANARVHTEQTALIGELKDEVEKQRDEIIEEFIKDVNALCDDYINKLNASQKKEDERYKKFKCAGEEQKSNLTKAMQSLETGINSNNLESMEQVVEQVSGTLKNLQQLDIPTMSKPEFFKKKNMQVEILYQVLERKEKVQNLKQLGKPTMSKQELVKREDMRVEILHQMLGRKIGSGELNTSRRGAPKRHSTIKVTGKKSCMRVILPSKDDTFWVADDDDKHLSLIDRQGKIIKTSSKKDFEFCDVKKYKNEMLVTYYYDQKVYKMSADGQRVSVMSDHQPYFTRGLCVTHEMDILLCLVDSAASNVSNDSKVVRLGDKGEIKQIIQKNSKGEQLFSNPRSVISLPSGEIVVADYTGGIKCISSEGRLIFTWDGKSIENKHSFKARFVSYDGQGNLVITDYDNDKVYELKKDGLGARCILDEEDGISAPVPVSFDQNGRLLVGRWGGEILGFGN